MSGYRDHMVTRRFSRGAVVVRESLRDGSMSIAAVEDPAAVRGTMMPLSTIPRQLLPRGVGKGRQGSLVIIEPEDEIISKRRDRSKGYAWPDPDTGEMRNRVHVAENRIHTRGGDEIDLGWKIRGPRVTAEGAPYTCEAESAEIRFTSEDGHRSETRSTAINGASFIMPSPTIDPVRPHVLRWDFSPSMHWELRLYWHGIRLHRILHDDTAPRDFTEETVYEGPLRFDKRQKRGWYGLDNYLDTAPRRSKGDRTARARGTVDVHRRLIVTAPRVDLQEAGWEHGERVRATWAGQVRAVDPQTRLVTPSNDVEYPVDLVMASIAQQDTTDDGYETQGAFDGYPSVIVMGVGYFDNFHGGFHFPSIPDIESGNVIDSATVTYQATDEVGTHDIEVHAEDVDDATGFGTDRPTQKTPTTAFGAVSQGSGAGSRTTDHTAALQEQVNRGGFAADNGHTVLALGVNPLTSEYHVVYVEDQDSGTGATVDADYSVGGGGGGFAKPAGTPSKIAGGGGGLAGR